MRWLVYNINGFIDFCWLVIQLHGHLFSLCWNWTFWSKRYGLNVRNLDINHWKVIECYSWLCGKSEGFGIQSLDAFEHRVRTVSMRSWWFELGSCCIVACLISAAFVHMLMCAMFLLSDDKRPLNVKATSLCDLHGRNKWQSEGRNISTWCLMFLASWCVRRDGYKGHWGYGNNEFVAA